MNLSVGRGEIVCLLGASGCGKTTTLRLAAGVDWPDSGSIRIGGALVAGNGAFVPPEHRSVGLVFQDFALFPHLTALRNVAFGLRGGTPAQKRERARGYLALVHMERYENAYPHELSGGEQQRVALARALAPEPHILLMDEPFSGLDTQLRGQVREETMALLKELGTATLVVTHDPEEALQISDRIALMRAGRLVQADTPGAMWSAPADLGVAKFFGEINVLDGRAAEGRAETPLGTVAAQGFSGPVRVAVRPSDVALAAPTEAGAVGLTVRSARFLGSTWRIEGRLDGADEAAPPFVVRLCLENEPRPGERLGIVVRPNRILIFPPHT